VVEGAGCVGSREVFHLLTSTWEKLVEFCVHEHDIREDRINNGVRGK
jgi:hypothetical protein